MSQPGKFNYNSVLLAYY